MRWEWLLPPALLVIVLLLRLPAFEQSVVDWDESIYLLMGQSLLDGHVPYTVVWDHKPPGIYGLFAMAQLVFGRSILAMRMLACLAIAASAYLLYRLGKDRLGSWQTGLLAGLLYAIFTLQNGGLATNAEILLAPFAILGFYLLWPAMGNGFRAMAGRHLRLLLTGLVFGLGLQVKFVVAFDLAAALFLAWWASLSGPAAVNAAQDSPNPGSPDGLPAARGRRELWTGTGVLLVGALTPLGLATLAFGLTGHLDAYLNANFTANLRYAASARFDAGELLHTLGSQLWQQPLLWLSLLVAPAVLSKAGMETGITPSQGAPSRPGPHPGRWTPLALLVVWLLFDLLGIILANHPYWHYYLQLLPPLCLIAALVIVQGSQRLAQRTRLPAAIPLSGILLMGLLPPLVQPARLTADTVRAWLQSNERIDLPGYLAEYLQARTEAGDLIYVVDYEPIIYYLSQTRWPTPYVLPSLLTEEGFGHFAGVEPLAELERIMLQAPRFVVAKREHPRRTAFYQRLDSHLSKDYVEQKTIQDIIIYRWSQR